MILTGFYRNGDCPNYLQFQFDSKFLKSWNLLIDNQLLASRTAPTEIGSVEMSEFQTNVL